MGKYLGLLLTLLTYLRVRSVAAELRGRSLERSHHKLFEEVLAKLEGKPRLTPSHRRDVASLLSHVRIHHVRWLFFLSRPIKRQISEVRRDVDHGVRPSILIPKIETLRTLTRESSQPGD